MGLFDDAMTRAHGVWGSLFPVPQRNPLAQSLYQGYNPLAWGQGANLLRQASPFSPANQDALFASRVAQARAERDDALPMAASQAASRPVGNYSVPADFYPLIAEAATRYNLDAALIRAVMEAESEGVHYRQGGGVLTSPAGAIGVMQLMPETARDLGVNPHDPRENLMGGAQYLAEMLKLAGGDVARALAFYNAGPYGQVENPETSAYVQRVMGLLDRYRGWNPGAQYARGANALPASQAALAMKAQEIMGQAIPYVWGGGRGGLPGLDCSSFVSRVYQEALGRRLTPHTDTSFYETVPANGPVQAGDLVYFEYPSSDGNRFPHVGMVLSTVGGQVRVVHHTTFGGTDSTRVDDVDVLARALGARVYYRRLPE